MKYFLFCFALLSLSACKPFSSSKSPVEGYCIHPLMNGGVPFELAPDVFFDGVNLSRTGEDKIPTTLTGAQCYLKPRKDTAESK